MVVVEKPKMNQGGERHKSLFTAKHTYYDNSQSGLTSENVQEAIDELKSTGGGSAGLQQAYQNGNFISTSSTYGPVTISGTEDVTIGSNLDFLKFSPGGPYFQISGITFQNNLGYDIQTNYYLQLPGVTPYDFRGSTDVTSSSITKTVYVRTKGAQWIYFDCLVHRMNSTENPYYIRKKMLRKTDGTGTVITVGTDEDYENPTGGIPFGISFSFNNVPGGVNIVMGNGNAITYMFSYFIRTLESY